MRNSIDFYASELWLLYFDCICSTKAIKHVNHVADMAFVQMIEWSCLVLSLRTEKRLGSVPSRQSGLCLAAMEGK